MKGSRPDAGGVTDGSRWQAAKAAQPPVQDRGRICTAAAAPEWSCAPPGHDGLTRIIPVAAPLSQLATGYPLASLRDSVFVIGSRLRRLRRINPMLERSLRGSNQAGDMPVRNRPPSHHRDTEARRALCVSLPLLRNSLRTAGVPPADRRASRPPAHARRVRVSRRDGGGPHIARFVNGGRQPPVGPVVNGSTSMASATPRHSAACPAGNGFPSPARARARITIPNGRTNKIRRACAARGRVSRAFRGGSRST